MLPKLKQWKFTKNYSKASSRKWTYSEDVMKTCLEPQWECVMGLTTELWKQTLGPRLWLKTNSVFPGLGFSACEMGIILCAWVLSVNVPGEWETSMW